MLAGPVLRAILLPRTMPLPGAVLCPSPLLLPRDCLTARYVAVVAGPAGNVGPAAEAPAVAEAVGPALKCRCRVYARARPSAVGRATMGRNDAGRRAWVQNLPSLMQIWLSESAGWWASWQRRLRD